MKKFLLIFLLVAVVMTGIVFAAAKIFSGRKIPEEIRSFEKINLYISGMRLSNEYEIICRGEETEVSLYQLYYADGKDERRLEKSTVLKTEEMIEILNSCGISGWDGFDGEHPKNVSDGEIFRFEAVINGNKNIHAEGSANFPKGYSEFVKKISALLDN